jgi:hypothetical protein
VSDDLHLSLPPQLVDAIAGLVAERIQQDGSRWPEWMSRKTAAAYLDVPKSRLEKDRSIPVYADKGRRFYRRSDLDAYMEGLRR